MLIRTPIPRTDSPSCTTASSRTRPNCAHSLIAKGVEFRSDTDSEVFAQLIAAMGGDTLEEAVRAALRLVTGTYGLVVLDAERPEALVVARQGSPVIFGIGEREMLVASDVAALVRHTQSVVHLDDGELAVLRADQYETSICAAAPP